MAGGVPGLQLRRTIKDRLRLSFRAFFPSCVGILLSVFLFSSVAQTLDELMFLADLPPPTSRPPVFLDF